MDTVIMNSLDNQRDEKKNTMEVNDTVNYLVTDIFFFKYIQWR